MFRAQQIREYSVCLVHSKFVHIPYVLCTESSCIFGIFGAQQIGAHSLCLVHSKFVHTPYVFVHRKFVHIRYVLVHSKLVHITYVWCTANSCIFHMFLCTENSCIFSMFGAQQIGTYSLCLVHSKFGFQAFFKDTYNLLNSAKICLIFFLTLLISLNIIGLSCKLW
jgi:hypothetical protein